MGVAVAGGLLALRLHFQPPTIPEYSLESSAGLSQLARGGQLEVRLRPAAPVTGAVGARAFLVRGTDVRPWNPPLQVSRDGTIRMAGEVDALFAGVPAGDWEIDVAVGRPETLPTAPIDVLRARDTVSNGRKAAWRLTRARIRLEM